MTHFEGDLRVDPQARYAILASRWNPRITDRLVEGAREALADNGVGSDDYDVIRVPGSWELPQIAARIAGSGRYAGIVALGCVIRGDTRHFEHVADECARGLMRVAIDSGVPIANGVLAVERHEDALARAGGSHGNKGEEAVLAVMEMASLYSKVRE